MEKYMSKGYKVWNWRIASLKYREDLIKMNKITNDIMSDDCFYIKDIESFFNNELKENDVVITFRGHSWPLCNEDKIYINNKNDKYFYKYIGKNGFQVFKYS